MIARPDVVKRSVTAHNSDVTVFCDWLEASALYDEQVREVSKAEVVDVLMEQEIYNDQDYCWEFVSNSWTVIRRRLSWLGSSSPFKVRDLAITRTCQWREAPAHTFCLAVSLGPTYPGWHEQFGPDYTDQGALFESLVEASLRCVFSHWQFTCTGWSRQHTVTLSSVVPNLAADLREEACDIALTKYAGTYAKESGLDIAWHMPFRDQRGGFPVYLAQCASGKGWAAKLHDLDLEVWRKLIDFKHIPAKAFALPFALLDKEFVQRSPRVGGLLLDRYRLLSAGAICVEWLPTALAKRLVAWLEPRVQWILDLDRA